MSLIGQVLQNRYHVVHLIGEGGMGRVYYGEDIRLDNREVAIKETINLESGESAENIAARIKAFQREAYLLAGKIKHPAIPKVIDYFQFEKNWYIIMEYIDGDSLEQQRIKNNKPFSIDEVLLWTDQLLQILDSLHNQTPRILHRDIKPSNIKVKDGKVYLLDFGLAKQLTGAKSTAASFMTPAYASPEQVTNKEVAEKSDLYSVAATMYCLLTNDVPISAIERSLEVAGGNLDPIKNIKEICPDLSQDVADVIMNALSIQPDARPTNAESMRMALKKSGLVGENSIINPNKTLPSLQLFSEAPTKLYDEEPTKKMPKKRQKNPKRYWPAALISLILIALVIMGVALYRYYARQRSASAAAVTNPTPTPKTPRQIATEFTEQAIEKIYANDYDAAKALAKQAVHSDPTYALAHTIYGDAFWDTNQSEEDSSKDSKSQISKAEILKIFEEKEPSTEEDYAARAWAFLVDNKWANARHDIEKVIAAKPNWAWALALKASILSNGICVKEKNSEDADAVINTLKQVNSLKPTYANAYRQLGNQYQCADRVPDAISSYTQAVNYWQTAPNYSTLGFLYLELNEKDKKKMEENIEKAKQYSLKAIEIDPNYSDSYIVLARIHEIKSEYKDCLTEANNSLSKKDSASGNYWWSFCRYEMASNDKDEKGFDEALEKIEKAIQLIKLSGDANKRENLAEYYYTQAGIRNVKAIYLYNVKYKNNRKSGKEAAKKEFEMARNSINNAISIDENNKRFQSVKNAIEKSLRVLK